MRLIGQQSAALPKVAGDNQAGPCGIPPNHIRIKRKDEQINQMIHGADKTHPDCVLDLGLPKCAVENVMGRMTQDLGSAGGRESAFWELSHR